MHGIEIDSCTSCFGAWFEGNELPDFLDKLEDGDFGAKTEDTTSASSSFETSNMESSFCPKCNQLASPYTVGYSDVTVLKCINCSGVWVKTSQIGSLHNWYRNAQPSEKLAIRTLPRLPAEDVAGSASVVKAMFNIVEDEVALKKFPAITLFIVLVNTLILVWAYFFPHKAWVFLNVPETIFKYPFTYAYTLFSSMFMHAGVFHLFFNMYFLWVFGDNIEDRIGPAKYVVFYLSCGIVAGLLHTFLTSHPEYPTLGASGAVSGIMGGYLFLYPKAKLKINVLIILLPMRFRLPVWFYLGLWLFGSQLVNAYLDSPGIAWYAHIGGFISGFGLMFGMRKFNFL
jgi:membrane associated rhomboid family serine protease/Zn-finger nucleic acid-binding protein